MMGQQRNVLFFQGTSNADLDVDKALGHREGLSSKVAVFATLVTWLGGGFTLVWFGTGEIAKDVTFSVALVTGVALAWFKLPSLSIISAAFIVMIASLIAGYVVGDRRRNAWKGERIEGMEEARLNREEEAAKQICDVGRNCVARYKWLGT